MSDSTELAEVSAERLATARSRYDLRRAAKSTIGIKLSRSQRLQQILTVTDLKFR